MTNIYTVLSLESMLSTATLQQQKNLVSSLTGQLSAAMVSLQVTGSAPSILATGSYGWNDLNIYDDSNPLQPMTVGGCANFLSQQPSQSALKKSIIDELVKTLPIPSSAVNIQYTVTCGSKYPFENRPDQWAVFSVTGLSIGGRFTLFASTANYVAYASVNIDHKLQPSEFVAPLSQENVRVALEQALRRVYLGSLQTYYGI